MARSRGLAESSGGRRGDAQRGEQSSFHRGGRAPGQRWAGGPGGDARPPAGRRRAPGRPKRAQEAKAAGLPAPKKFPDRARQRARQVPSVRWATRWCSWRPRAPRLPRPASCRALALHRERHLRFRHVRVRPRPRVAAHAGCRAALPARRLGDRPSARAQSIRFRRRAPCAKWRAISTTTAAAISSATRRGVTRCSSSPSSSASR